MGRKENCDECKYHDVFWGSSGCNLLNNGERCKFEPKTCSMPRPCEDHYAWMPLPEPPKEE